MRLHRTLVLFIIAAAAIGLLVMLTGNGGIVDLLAKPCERMAQSMNAPYYFHPADGCLIQQPDGTWREYGGNNNHQP